MSIRTRLIFAFSMLLALMISQAVIAVSQVGRLADMATDVSSRAMARVEHVSHVANDLVELRAAQLSYLLRGPQEETWQQASNRVAELLPSIQTAIEEYRAVIDDPVRLADYEAFLLHVDDYRQAHVLLMVLAEAGRMEEGRALFSAQQQAFDTMMFHIHRIRHEEFLRALESGAEAASSATRARYLFGFATGIVALVEVGLGWYIWRSFSVGLNILLTGTRRVSQGDLSEPIHARTGDEFEEVAQAFNAMLASLKRSQEETARMQEERVHLLKDRLTRVVRAQEEERQRVARELHDQAGQSLTAIQFGLARLERSAQLEQARQQAGELRTLAVEAMEEIRNLAWELRPGALDELGLIPALRGYTREFSKRLGIPVEFSVTGQEKRLPSEMEVALFRVVQEGLTNVAKHAQASHAWVDLKLNANGLVLVISDKGKGFDLEQTLRSAEQQSVGLVGMKERVELLHGSFRIESQVGEGTRLLISIPFTQEFHGLSQKEGEEDDED